MRPLRLLLLVALLTMAAGCLGDTPEPASSGADQASVGNATAAGNLTTPPDWEPGTWWRIRFTDPTPEADGATYTTTRVVSGTTNDSYLVGMPPSDFNDKLLVWHMPGFGNVDQEDLGFLVHGTKFKPLDFPLKEGKTWETTFQQPLTAEVVSVDGSTATVAFTASAPGGGSYKAMEVVYDGSEGFIAEMTSFPGPVSGSAASHGRYEVVAHGDDYGGTVQTPVDRREVFFSIRLAGALLGPNPVSSPRGSTDVPGGVDRVTLAHVLGEIHGQTPTTGLYDITTETPGGRVIQDRLLPGNAPGRHVTYYGVWDASGTWSFDHVAAGTGATVAEGIGYAVRNVTLPAS